MEIDKILKVNQLLDIYGKLLTNKQFEAMNLYYVENLSFGEIGEELNISRQAAYDTIKKSEQLLYGYEEILCINSIQKNTDYILNSLSEKLLDFKRKYSESLNNEQLKDIQDMQELFKESSI